MAGPVKSVPPPGDSWEEEKRPVSERPSLRALADFIEITTMEQRGSEVPPTPAVSTPTTPPESLHPSDLLLIETAEIVEMVETTPPPALLEGMKREVMPSNLPEPTLSRMPPSAASTIAMGTIENLVSQNQWTKVCEILGAPENQGKLPVGMAFIYAVALNELRVPGSPVDQRAPDIEKIMLRCLGVMLGTDAKGPLAQIVAKRLMRRSWRTTPAPPARLSVMLIVAALVVGSFIGFLIGPGRDWFKQ